VPPKQCPECGRFLRNDYVTALANGPAPCPRCGTELTAAAVDAADSAEGVAAGASVRPADATVEVDVAEAEAPSVRPPDAEPVADVLSGWDPDGYTPQSLDDLRAADRTPQMAAAGAAAGALAGLVFLPGRRSKGVLLGGLAGALAGVAAARLAPPQN